MLKNITVLLLFLLDFCYANNNNAEFDQLKHELLEVYDNSQKMQSVFKDFKKQINNLSNEEQERVIDIVSVIKENYEGYLESANKSNTNVLNMKYSKVHDAKKVDVVIVVSLFNLLSKILPTLDYDNEYACLYVLDDFEKSINYYKSGIKITIT